MCFILESLFEKAGQFEKWKLLLTKIVRRAQNYITFLNNFGMTVEYEVGSFFVLKTAASSKQLNYNIIIVICSI